MAALGRDMAHVDAAPSGCAGFQRTLQPQNMVAGAARPYATYLLWRPVTGGMLRTKAREHALKSVPALSSQRADRCVADWIPA